MVIDHIVIISSSPSKKEAIAVIDSLLKDRLIACANIIPRIESKFWWNQKIDKAKEVMIMLKTRKANYGRIEKEIARLHSYDVPEIIAIPIIAGSRSYLQWMDGCLKHPSVGHKK